MQKEEFYNLLENPHLLNVDTLSELKNITEKFPFFQAAKILYLKNLRGTNHPDYEPELKRIAPLIPDRKQLYRFIHSKEEHLPGHFQMDYQKEAPSVYSFEKTEEPPVGDNLIDKFLSSERTTIKIEKKANESMPEDTENEILSKSVSESDELITETLAMIYFEQKKYDRALEAFQKLSLKYPEKSVYFASRIEEIEKLKNI